MDQSKLMKMGNSHWMKKIKLLKWLVMSKKLADKLFKLTKTKNYRRLKKFWKIRN